MRRNFSNQFVLCQLAWFISCSSSSPLAPHDYTNTYEPEPKNLRKIADPADTKKAVQTCAANVTLGWTSSAGGKYVTDGYYGSTSIPMEIRSNGDSVTLTTELTLHFPEADHAMKEELQKRLDETKPCLTEFFSKHGIILSLTFYNEGDPAAPVGDSSQINLRLYGERGATINEKNWAFGSDGTLFEPGYACTLIAHEFGHRLGLLDEYEDEKVPNRFIGEDDSIMKTLSIDPQQVKLYPRHITAIFEAMCP
ncbi:MAG: hypothetical protein HY537_03635 [Deltaproteobacteria bacterium]|nr:hypothetical protein [Deltaproteobacteria bacterium]